MADWTGTVSGTVANGDRITGNLTVSAGTTLTFAPGATVTVTGNYGITTIAGTVVCVGTPTQRITIKAATLPQSAVLSHFAVASATSANIAIQYANIYNATSVIRFGTNSITGTISVDHVFCGNSTNFVTIASSVARDHTFSNCFIEGLPSGPMGSSSGSSGTITFDRCTFRYTAGIATTTAITEVIYNDCLFVNNSAGSSTIKTTYTNSLSINTRHTMGTVTTHAITNSIVTGCAAGAALTGVSSGYPTITGCDLVLNSGNYAMTTGGILNNCYIASNRSAGYTNYCTTPAGSCPASNQSNFLAADINASATTISLTNIAGFVAPGGITIESEKIYVNAISGNDFTGCVRGAQATTAASHASGGGTLAVTQTAITGYFSTSNPPQTNNITQIISPRTTRNFTFTPASVTESSLGTNGVTIGWTVGFRTFHRIRYGTVSGTYTMVAEPNYSWSQWQGSLQTAMTATPSIALANLKSGTKYYYVVESMDPEFMQWETSAEGDFTTTSETTGGGGAGVVAVHAIRI